MRKQSSLKVGIDIGGTFTDLVVFDDEQNGMLIAKTPSVSDNYSAGVITALVPRLCHLTTGWNWIRWGIL